MDNQSTFLKAIVFLSSCLFSMRFFTFRTLHLNFFRLHVVSFFRVHDVACFKIRNDSGIMRTHLVSKNEINIKVALYFSAMS